MKLPNLMPAKFSRYMVNPFINTVVFINTEVLISTTNSDGQLSKVAIAAALTVLLAAGLVASVILAVVIWRRVNK